MNSYGREIKVEKLKNNLNRQHYLKVLSIACLSLDLFAYILFESIELAFTDINKQKGLLACYIVKVSLLEVLIFRFYCLWL
jgi:hypothetical protein